MKSGIEGMIGSGTHLPSPSPPQASLLARPCAAVLGAVVATAAVPSADGDGKSDREDPLLPPRHNIRHGYLHGLLPPSSGEGTGARSVWGELAPAEGSPDHDGVKDDGVRVRVR
jgi:hypothetical protein